MRRADLFRLVVQRLAVGISVRGVHQAMLNTKLLMQDLSSRGQAVRGATPVAYYHVLSRIVLLVVNAHHHRQIVIFTRRGDDDALRPTVGDMHQRFFALGEETGRFNHHVNARIAPGNIRRIAFAKDGNALAVNLQRAVRRFNGCR